MILKTNKQSIVYELKHSRRARNLRLAVYYTGNVVVTAPVGFDISRIEDFLQQKISWVIKKLDFFKNHPRALTRKVPRDEYLRQKAAALVLAEQKVALWNQKYNFLYNRVSVKNQSTRWGSCSRQRNLNFNYQILYLPDYLVDYLVVHELCHLQEFNHSAKFWTLVAEAIPNYKLCRKELKNHERI
ncbi:MAG: M48 family metallopeptidase [Patescibacteria group bacterium]|nr:M48 family metallopeptidase [Patescibacteria group bacterium]